MFNGDTRICWFSWVALPELLGSYPNISSTYTHNNEDNNEDTNHTQIKIKLKMGSKNSKSLGISDKGTWKTLESTEQNVKIKKGREEREVIRAQDKYFEMSDICCLL